MASTIRIDGEIDQVLKAYRRPGETKNAVLKRLLWERLQQDDLGIPDLSLVTIRQFTDELKTRDNISFALVWMDDHGQDNISVEGHGNASCLVGLLSRGTHMAIEWADKAMTFQKPPDDSQHGDSADSS